MSFLRDYPAEGDDLAGNIKVNSRIQIFSRQPNLSVFLSLATISARLTVVDFDWDDQFTFISDNKNKLPSLVEARDSCKAGALISVTEFGDIFAGLLEIFVEIVCGSLLKSQRKNNFH